MSFRQPIIHISEWLPPGVAALSTKVVPHWLGLPTGQCPENHLGYPDRRLLSSQSHAIICNHGRAAIWKSGKMAAIWKNGHFNAETSGRSGYFYKTKNWKERNRDILHKAQIARLVFMGVAKTFVVTESHSVTILAFPHFWGKRKACASISFDLNTSFHRNIKVGQRK